MLERLRQRTSQRPPQARPRQQHLQRMLGRPPPLLLRWLAAAGPLPRSSLLHRRKPRRRRRQRRRSGSARSVSSSRLRSASSRPGWKPPRRPEMRLPRKSRRPTVGTSRCSGIASAWRHSWRRCGRRRLLNPTVPVTRRGCSLRSTDCARPPLTCGGTSRGSGPRTATSRRSSRTPGRPCAKPRGRPGVRRRSCRPRSRGWRPSGRSRRVCSSARSLRRSRARARSCMRAWMPCGAILRQQPRLPPRLHTRPVGSWRPRRRRPPAWANVSSRQSLPRRPCELSSTRRRSSCAARSRTANGCGTSSRTLKMLTRRPLGTSRRRK
mmetsp:Transcript_47718/g.153565  ORF Transcript_47718/g.153565 Transcript_47718/m.153565 type:complete len:323 (-) Transcript_47718:618-1586(-)